MNGFPRVYLIEFSMGAFGAWHLVAAMPGKFAAIIPVAGGGDERTADQFSQTAVWAIHGDADPTVPCESSVKMVKAIQSAGLEAKLTLMPGMNHRSWYPFRESPHEYLDWLFSHALETP